MDVDGSAGRGGRLPAAIQSGEAAQPAGLREPGDFCGAELSSPSSGRAAPSLRRGWTKNKQKHKLNHVPGLTHGLDQKSEPGHRRHRRRFWRDAGGRSFDGVLLVCEQRNLAAQGGAAGLSSDYHTYGTIMLICGCAYVVAWLILSLIHIS